MSDNGMSDNGMSAPELARLITQKVPRVAILPTDPSVSDILVQVDCGNGLGLGLGLFDDSRKDPAGGGRRWTAEIVAAVDGRLLGPSPAYTPLMRTAARALGWERLRQEGLAPAEAVAITALAACLAIGDDEPRGRIVVTVEVPGYLHRDQRLLEELTRIAQEHVARTYLPVPVRLSGEGAARPAAAEALAQNAVMRAMASRDPWARAVIASSDEHLVAAGIATAGPGGLLVAAPLAEEAADRHLRSAENRRGNQGLAYAGPRPDGLAAEVLLALRLERHQAWREVIARAGIPVPDSATPAFLAVMHDIIIANETAGASITVPGHVTPGRLRELHSTATRALERKAHEQALAAGDGQGSSA